MSIIKTKSVLKLSDCLKAKGYVLLQRFNQGTYIDPFILNRDELENVIGDLQRYLHKISTLPPVFEVEVPIGEYAAMDAFGQWASYPMTPLGHRSRGDWGGGGTNLTVAEASSKNEWPNWLDSLFYMTEKGLVKV